MIEQEKREKAIEEMTKSVMACENSCKDCSGWCVAHFNAIRFYDADYRKKKEVEIETAKIFLDEIMSRVTHIDTAYGELCFAVETKDILEIAKERFGLEVE